MADRNFFKSLWQDDRGQSTTEYILILAIVVMVALQVKKQLPDKLGKILGQVTSQIDEVSKIE